MQLSVFEDISRGWSLVCAAVLLSSRPVWANTITRIVLIKYDGDLSFDTEVSPGFDELAVSDLPHGSLSVVFICEH